MTETKNSYRYVIENGICTEQTADCIDKSIHEKCEGKVTNSREVCVEECETLLKNVAGTIAQMDATYKQ